MPDPVTFESDEPAPPLPSAHGIFWILVLGTFAQQGLALVSGVVSARMLGVEGRGIVAVVFTVSVMATQLTFGGSFSMALARQVTVQRIALRDALRPLRHRAWVLLLPSVAAGIAAPVMARHLDLGQAVQLAVVAVIITLQTVLARLIFAGIRGELAVNYSRLMAFGLVSQAAYVGILVAAQVSGWHLSAVEVLIAYALASLLGQFIGFGMLRKPTHRPEDTLDPGELWRETRNGYIGSMGPLDSIGLDRMAIGALLGPYQLGLYAAATAVATMGAIVAGAITTGVLPLVARESTHAGQLRVIRRWTLVTGVATLVLALALQVVVGPVITIAFGDGFKEAIEPARWLIAADAIFSMRKVLVTGLQGQGRSGVASAIELALTPLLVAGIAFGALSGHLTPVGIAMTVVAVIAVATLGTAVVRRPGSREQESAPAPV